MFGKGRRARTHTSHLRPPDHPHLLKTWAQEERSHGGVIFVDQRTISPPDVGGLVLALTRLVMQGGEWDWTDRVVFLKRQNERR